MKTDKMLVCQPCIDGYKALHACDAPDFCDCDDTQHHPTDVSMVLADVAEHVQFQRENYGDVNRGMPDGTGPDVEWLKPVTDDGWEHYNHSHYPKALTAFEIEGLFREEWDYPKDGTPEEQADAQAKCTRMRLLREEVAEAFAQSDPRWLEAELIQVAALCVSWITDIRERQS